MRRWLARHRRAADEATPAVVDETVEDTADEPRHEVAPRRRRYAPETHLPREQRPHRPRRPEPGS